MYIMCLNHGHKEKGRDETSEHGLGKYCHDNY